MNPAEIPVVVNVATGAHYLKGQARLCQAMNARGQMVLKWSDALPEGSPPHADVPYAFKAYAIRDAFKRGFQQILWCDSCIIPAGNLTPIWDHAEEYGVWMSRNGYRNDEWTAESAYPDLFPEVPSARARALNSKIEHVVATAFALDLRHWQGCAFMHRYFELAQTKAFCGPWTGGVGVQHRHDQTAASVIAWRLGIPLTEPPKFFAYAGHETESTVLIADGNY